MILALIFLQMFHCKLEIMQPASLKEKFPKNLEYSIGNIGHIPYGQTFIGEAKLSDPIKACEPIKNSGDAEKRKSFFLVVERGDCPFVTKA